MYDDIAMWQHIYASQFLLKMLPPTQSTQSRYSNSSVQIQIEPKSQFEFVPQDTGEPEFLDWMDFGDVKFSVETASWGYGVATISRLLKV